MKSCGINIGSSSIKVVVLDEGKIVSHKIQDHEGDFLGTLRDIMSDGRLEAGIKALVTGTDGRYLLNINNAIESI
ncbi:MAG: hypothetical protein MUC95_05475, partial [Spirochaetes bacterium]|nr:hypothetical protein [Spirochaetota bacterium]